MLITAAQAILLQIPCEQRSPQPALYGRPWRTLDSLLLRVETDAGITGWGEAFSFHGGLTTRAALDSLVIPNLIGRDPSQIVPLMNDLQRRLHLYGRTGPVACALSAVDIALWDINGKMAGMPLFRMLGGSTRTHLPAYASLLRTGDPAHASRSVEAALKRGFRSIKLHEVDLDPVHAARDVAGYDIPLMLDVDCPWNPGDAIEMCRRMADLELYWLEEPVWPPENYDGIADVRSNGGIPIAAGVLAGSAMDFKHLVVAEAIDFAQPSVGKVGGVTELRKVIALASAYNVTVHPHSPYLGPALLATLHVNAAAGEDMLVEHLLVEPEATLYGAAVRPFNGSVAVPQGPGLGIDPDMAVLERYRAP